MRTTLAAAVLIAAAAPVLGQFKQMKKKADANTYVSPMGFQVTAPKTKEGKRYVHFAKQEEDGSESVYLFPKGLEGSAVAGANEAEFRKMGAVKIESLPKSQLPPERQKNALKAVEEDMTSSFKEEGKKFTVKHTPISGYKAVRIDVKKPPMTHLILEGKRFMFILRTGKPALVPAVVVTLKEVKPEEGAAPAQLPPGVELPPGTKLPPGVTLPGMPGEEKKAEEKKKDRWKK